MDHYLVGGEVILSAPLVLDQVQRVANRLGSKAGFECQVRIINSSEVNAFATAGGYIYVTTGLLDFVESEDELAAAMAHELSHSIGQHYFLMLKQQEKKSRRIEMFSGIVSLVISSALRYRWVAAQSDIGTIFLESQFGAVTAATLAVSLAAVEESRFRSYGKTLELAADIEGAKLAASAGYGDRALISLFKRMALMAEKQKHEEAKILKLLGDEPTLAVRIRALEDH